MRDHSDDPEVVFSDPGKNKVKARRVNFNAPDKDNSNDQGKGSGPGKVNSNGPGGWTERVAGRPEHERSATDPNHSRDDRGGAIARHVLPGPDCQRRVPTTELTISWESS